MTQRAKEMLELATSLEQGHVRVAHLNERNKWVPYQTDLVVEALRLAAQADAPGGLDAATVEEIARWHDGQSNLAMNSLHSGDNFATIIAARRTADHHTYSAASIRALTSGKKP